MRGILLLFLLMSSLCFGQDRFDYSDIKEGKFSAKTISGVRSLADGEHYTTMSGGKIVRYDYRTGSVTDTIFSTSKFDEMKSCNLYDYTFSPNQKLILLTTNVKPIYRRSFRADNWVYNIADQTVFKLSDAGAEQVAQFSPDAKRIAFVRDNDIWTVDLADHSLTRVTFDGQDGQIINGHTDWVYEEEFGFTRAFEFSPDGSKIAFLRLNETDVSECTIPMIGGLRTSLYTYKYPKAGDKNSIVELYMCDISGTNRVKVETDEQIEYIPRIGWTPSGELFYYCTNRLQNRFDLQLFDGASSRNIYTESNPRYVANMDEQSITFLPDAKRFVVRSECNGFTHLYLYSIEKGFLNPITNGSWEVTSLSAIVGERLYYISCEGSPLRRNLYSIKLNGRDKKRLTHQDGTYTVAPSRGFKYFISYFSNASTPNTVTLHGADGGEVRVLERNSDLKAQIKAVDLPIKEFFGFKTERGDSLLGYIIKPRDFDASKRYPVLMSQYSGPGSQEVVDKWGIGWTDVLVQNGYIIACIDGRGTGCRGEQFKKCTYADLGAKETEDQISAARYMASMSYVDRDRIGIYGWSYGGFMALNCALKGNDVYRMAIAVAPVTSWRFYDSVYTEAYNGLPDDNNSGYDRNAPVLLADSLRANLLIIHGTADDNVHIENTYRMVDALVRADKKFDMMIYPDNNHSMRSSGRHHIMERMIAYTLDNL